MADSQWQGIDKTNLTANVFIPEGWDSELLVAFKDDYAGFAFVKRNMFFGYHAGDKVHKATISRLDTAKTKSVETATDAEDIDAAESDKSITLDQTKYSKVGIEWDVRMESLPDIMSAYVAETKDAIGKAIDTYIYSLNSGFTPTAVGTDNAALTYDVVLAALEALFLQNVPRSGLGMFISPKMLTDLLGMREFTSTDYSGLGRIQVGDGAQVGSFLGGKIPVFMTNNLAAGSAGKKGILMHKSCIELGILGGNPRTQVFWDPHYHTWFGDTACVYGASVMRPTAGVVIQGK